MRIIQEPNKLALSNKRHFEQKKNGVCAACLKYSVRVFVEQIFKMHCLDVSCTVRPIDLSLGFKGLKGTRVYLRIIDVS
jgi:hypothetical protein